MAEKQTAKIGKGKPGPGRPKGVPNKLNGQLKEMILQALDNAGGVDYLVTQSAENPTAFLALVGKVLPMTVAGAGENGEHLTEITFRVLDGKAGD